jgi:hypothetical protein
MPLRQDKGAFKKSFCKVEEIEPVASAFTFGIGLTFTLPVDESVEISIN